MPRLDGAGPVGYGPGTGWDRGPCGAGWGRRWGRQGGYGFRQFISPKNELAALEEEEKALEEELAIVREEEIALKNQSR